MNNIKLEFGDPISIELAELTAIKDKFHEPETHNCDCDDCDSAACYCPDCESPLEFKHYSDTIQCCKTWYYSPEIRSRIFGLTLALQQRQQLKDLKTKQTTV